jgi:hypothetical protein
MIRIYTGNLGTGKTLHMVRDLIEDMKHGATVVSNTPIRTIYKGKVLESITISKSEEFMKALINSWNVIIAIDELAVFFPSDFWSQMPPELTYKFAQSRKMACDFYGTTQGIMHTIKRLRDLTNEVVECSLYRFFLPLPCRPKIYLPDGTFYKSFDLLRPICYRGITYNPELYKHSIVDPEKLKQFEYSRDLIYPAEARRLYKAYNTYFRVKGSAMGDFKGLIEDFKAVSDNNEKLLQEDVLLN